MDTPKAYTVRTETGEIRLMTQEEVGALVRTSLRQQQQTPSSKKVASSLSPSPRGTLKKKAVIMSATKSANGPTTETTATSPTSRFQFPATSRRLSRHNWSSRRRQQQQQPKQQQPLGNNNVSSPEREDEVEAVATNTAAKSPSKTSTALSSNQDGSDTKTPTISNYNFSERESRHEKSSTRAGTSPSTLMTSTDERFTAMVTRSFPIKTEKEGLQNMSETEINDLVRNSIQRARRQLQQHYNAAASPAATSASPPPLSPRLRKFSWSFDNETEDLEERDDTCTQKEEGDSRSNDKATSQQSVLADVKEVSSTASNVATTNAEVAIPLHATEEKGNHEKEVSEAITPMTVLSEKEISQMVEKTLEKPIATVEGPIWEVTDIVQDTMRRASELASATQSSSPSSNGSKAAEKKNHEGPKQISENGGGSCGIECSLSGNFHTASTTLASSSASTAASASSLSHSSNKEQQDKEEEIPSSPAGEKNEIDNFHHPESLVTHPDSNQDVNDDSSLITKEWNITIVSGGRDVVGSEGDFPEDEDGASLGKVRKNVASATTERRESQNNGTGKSDKSAPKMKDEGPSEQSSTPENDLSAQVLLKESSNGENNQTPTNEPNVISKATTDLKADAIPDCLSDPEAYTLAEPSPELSRKSKALAMAKSSIAFTSFILSQKTIAQKKGRAQDALTSLTVDTREHSSSSKPGPDGSITSKDCSPSVDEPTSSEMDPASWEPLIPPSSAPETVNKDEICANEKDSMHADHDKCDSEKNTPRWQNGRLIKKDFSDAGKRQQVSTRILSILAAEVSPTAESKKKLRSRRFRRAKYASKPIGSGPRKSKSDKQMTEKDSAKNGSMVITDEFLAEIASKKGSAISPEELSQMIQTATKSHHTASSTEEDEDEGETTTIGGTTTTATVPTVANSNGEVDMEIPSKKMSSEEPLSSTKTGFCMDCLDLLGFVDDDDPCFGDDEDFTVHSRNETTWEDDETTIVDQTEDENAGDTTDAENGGVEVTDRGEDDEAEYDEAGTAIFALTSQERRRVTFSFSDGHQTMTMTDYDASSSDESTAHSGYE